MSTQGDKLKAIADAIRAKEGSSDPIAANDFPARIAAIETGTQLPTLTNPGTAADMAQGKQLIDQNGEIVTGTLRESTAGSGYTVIDTTPTLNSTNLQLDYTFEMDRIMRKDSILNMMCPISNFGNATAADVAAGKTFTSEAGVKVIGSASISSNYGVTVYNNTEFIVITLYTPFDGTFDLTSGNRQFQVPAEGCFAVRCNYHQSYTIQNLGITERLTTIDDADQYFSLHVFQVHGNGGMIAFDYSNS